MTSGAKTPNRLASEGSPYLRQHARNPVDWHPWGPGAFAEARRRDVPIFLSIGYSTCYWCHVMERECFESEAIARVLNENLVCVKVDREERPDVDDAYMNALLSLRGQGGWPMSIFLEPQGLRPFWCATYLPPEPRGSLPSLGQVVENVARAWREQRPEVLSQAQSLAAAVRENMSAKARGVRPTSRSVEEAVAGLLQTFDRTHGGFGRAPKFPQPLLLEFLLDARRAVAGEDARKAIDVAVISTLDAMSCGGLHDHAGGGFHRYSVDESWTVPHFEKMLYDNAMLAGLYARAASVYGQAWHARVARSTVAFLAREMASPAGGFYAALDAEVDAREGLNYLWTPGEIRAALPEDLATLALRVYGLEDGPNFQDPHHPGEKPRNILRLTDHPARLAKELGFSVDEFFATLDQINTALLALRQGRPSPHRDEKRIASWNGLAIAACVAVHEMEGADRSEALTLGVRAAEFVAGLLIDPAGRLRRNVSGEIPGPAGGLEDYACVILGLTRLSRARGVEKPGRWLKAASDLARVARELFFDPKAGVCYDVPLEREDLFVRVRGTHDGAMPSGQSVMIHALLDLHAATGDRTHADDALAILGSMSGEIVESPVGRINAVRALLRVLMDKGLDPGEETVDRHPTPEPRAPQEGPSPVAVLSGVERVEVARSKPGMVELMIEITPPWHVVAAVPHAEPAVAGMYVPFRVGVTGGAGVAVYADYPSGEKNPDAPDDPRAPLVYTSTFRLPVLLELEGKVSGRPLLTLSYQACRGQACAAPTTVELDVAIDVV